MSLKTEVQTILSDVTKSADTKIAALQGLLKSTTASLLTHPAVIAGASAGLGLIVGLVIGHKL